MKLVDIKLTSLTYNVQVYRNDQNSPAYWLGTPPAYWLGAPYPSPKAEATVVSERGESGLMTVGLTDEERQAVAAIFEKITKRLRSE